MNGYGVMAIIGGVIWIVCTLIYAVRYKSGIAARKWWGRIAYLGLAILIGCGMEYFKDTLENYSKILVFGGVALFIYITSRIYVFNNIEQ